ncbi:DUF1853 family protein [Litchfieldella xinjiangensis]|uniref:DUF1853 family protein n=1 Tax=Litchfieldella xinjiangensis TaxID=1166948 RepID=UPI0006932637|nr:DUF1853 family protein [Halomonas xinjiangensis]
MTQPEKHEHGERLLKESFAPCSASLSGDLASLGEPWVRDIAWLLHAPDMADIGYRGRPSLTELGLDEDDRRRAWLRQQERKADDFARWLQQRRSSRLGIYHETLWQWILARAPHTRLLATNVALRDDTRTLGELDLVYADRTPEEGPSNPTHVELAIKFYLGLPDGPGDADDAARWIGLDSVDSLAIKAQRLGDKQLPMGLTALADPHLARSLPVAHFQQRVIMPGCLYSPWGHDLPLPRLAHPEAMRGVWCHFEDWHDLAAHLPADYQGVLIHKPHWLAPPQPNAWEPLDAIGDRLVAHFSEHRAARHVLLSRADGGICRVFVVANGWPRVVALPPANETA